MAIIISQNISRQSSCQKYHSPADEVMFAVRNGTNQTQFIAFMQIILDKIVSIREKTTNWKNVQSTQTKLLKGNFADRITQKQCTHESH